MFITDIKMTELQCFLFGFPRWERKGRVLPVHRRKSLALAAYLAVTRKAHLRETLAKMFWPGEKHQSAQASLRTALWQLNKTCGPDWLKSSRDHVEMSREKSAAVDVNRFESYLTKGAERRHSESAARGSGMVFLSRAAEMYLDDFMAGFRLPDSPVFEQWKQSQARRLRNDLIGILERLIALYAGRGEYEQALVHARRWAYMDPADESAQALLMKLYARLGRSGQALKQYQEYVQARAGSRDIGPGKNIRKLYLDLKAESLTGFPTLNRKRADHRPHQKARSPVPGLPEVRFREGETVHLKK